MLSDKLRGELVTFVDEIRRRAAELADMTEAFFSGLEAALHDDATNEVVTPDKVIPPPSNPHAPVCELPHRGYEGDVTQIRDTGGFGWMCPVPHLHPPQE